MNIHSYNSNHHTNFHGEEELLKYEDNLRELENNRLDSAKLDGKPRGLRKANMKLKILTIKEKEEIYRQIALFCEKNEFRYKRVDQPKIFGGSIEIKIQIPDVKKI